MMSSRLEAALTAFDDPAAKARELLRLHYAWSSTHEVPAQVRAVVARAWGRQGLPPGPGRPLGEAALVERRQRSAGLASVVPLLKERLLPLAAEAGNELVVSDDEGYILWDEGPAPVRHKSEKVGFVEGVRWRERDVGVNSLGTAMEERRPVQIFGPEHGNEDQYLWVCTSVPILERRRGALIGVVTLSGFYRTAHPYTLSLVSMAATEATAQLADEHSRELRRLSGHAAEVGTGPALVVDDDGWVAHAQGFGVGERIWLPGGLREGRQWLPGLGNVLAASIDGGWLLRGARAETELELVEGPPPAVVVRSAGETTEIFLTARHFEILSLLAAHPEGLGTADFLRKLDSAQSEVTVRAELSRLRKRLGGLVESRPYRLTVPVAAHTR